MDHTDDTISLPDPPDVPGLVFRRFRGESDYAGITAVGNASREADGVELVLGINDIANEFTHLANSTRRAT